jgi:aspartyl/asparaginyl-tRNA synthetase
MLNVVKTSGKSVVDVARFRTIKSLLAQYQQPNTVNHLEKKVGFSGWVTGKHKMKGLTFLRISDGSVHNGIQCLIREDSPQAWKQVVHITVGSFLDLEGIITPSSGSKQAWEIVVEDLGRVSESKVFRSDLILKSDIILMQFNDRLI